MNTILLATDHKKEKFYFHVVDDGNNELFRSVTLLEKTTGKSVKLTYNCIRRIKENIKICLENSNYNTTPTHTRTHLSNGVRFSSGEQKLVRGVKVNSHQAQEIISYFEEKILETV